MIIMIVRHPLGATYVNVECVEPACIMHQNNRQKAVDDELMLQNIK